MFQTIAMAYFEKTRVSQTLVVRDAPSLGPAWATGNVPGVAECFVLVKDTRPGYDT